MEELEWAIEEALKTGMVVAATMAISVKGDMNGVPIGECAVRMARAGAHVGEWKNKKSRYHRYASLLLHNECSKLMAAAEGIV